LSEVISRLTRRDFLWTLGSGLAATGLTAGGLAACGGSDPGTAPAATGGVRGTVTDLQGVPQSIGRIYLLLDNGLNQNIFADVSALGAFDLGQVPAGKYQVRFWGGSQASVPEPLENPVRVTVTANAVTVVPFKIVRGMPNETLHEIYAGDFFFQDQPFGDPNATVIVKLGVTVCWYNVGFMDHSVTGGPWGDSGTISKAEEFMWPATQVGSFGYRCKFHNPQMQAILQVVP
jgi:plastocyanin